MRAPTEIGDAGFERIMLTAATNAPWMIPVWQAVKEGQIELDLVTRDGKLQRFYVASETPTPILIIIGDDGGDDRGPAGWPKIQKTIGYAEAIMVNAAGGSAEHYRFAAESARAIGVVAMVETQMRHLEAWQSLLATMPAKRTMFIVARGGVHPVREETRH